MRELLVREATRLFAERGYGATSLQDVASAVGVTKQALLYHFKSKDALKEVVLQRLMEQANQSLVRLISALDPDEDRRLEQMLDQLQRIADTEPHAAALVLRLLLDRGPGDAERLRTGVQPWFTFMADLIRRGQKDGRIRSELDPEAAIAQVGMLVLTNFALLPVHDGSAESPAAWRDRRLVELVRAIRVLLFVEGVPRTRRRSR